MPQAMVVTVVMIVATIALDHTIDTKMSKGEKGKDLRNKCKSKCKDICSKMLLGIKASL